MVGSFRSAIIIAHRGGAAVATGTACSLPRLHPNSGSPEFGQNRRPKSDKSEFGWRGGEGGVRKGRPACPLPVHPPQAGEGTLRRAPLQTPTICVLLLVRQSDARVAAEIFAVVVRPQSRRADTVRCKLFVAVLGVARHTDRADD